MENVQTVLCVLGSGALPGVTLQTLLSAEKVLLQTVVFLSEGQLLTPLRFGHAMFCGSQPAGREVLAGIQKLLHPGARMVVLEESPSSQVSQLNTANPISTRSVVQAVGPCVSNTLYVSACRTLAGQQLFRQICC